MPIYEYMCPGCGQRFDKRVGFADADERQECPDCGNKHASRQISLIGGISGASKGGSSVSLSNCGPVG